MAKYRCMICGFVYDEEEGFMDAGIAPGTLWADVPETFTCPWCFQSKSEFELIEEEAKVENTIPFESEKHLSPDIRVPIDIDNPSIMRIEENCVKCGQCTEVCKNYIGVLGTYTLKDNFDQAVCINCGQCANVCPTNAIVEKYEYEDVIKQIKDPDKIVIFSTSPSIRVALGEEFGEELGSFVQGKIVSLLKKLGASYVLDTNFSADLTIMEEASELIDRITNNKVLPQFTSCCPSWVKFAEIYLPEYLPNISSSKSPIGMQGATIKTYFAKKMGLDPKKIVNVAITPCTAKKMEIRREEMNASAEYNGIDTLRDMDYVITTRELAKWAKEEKIDFKTLEDSSFDSLMQEATGSGVIFGNSGGVMEAALRTAYYFINKKEVPESLLEYTPVRGYANVKEACVKINDELTINVAAIYGTEAAYDFVKSLDKMDKKYHFIEVMTCPLGCIGGGGQPKSFTESMDVIRKKRMEGLYKKDSSLKARSSYENKEIEKLYSEFYQKPLSPLAEKMLHTTYSPRKEKVSK